MRQTSALIALLVLVGFAAADDKKDVKGLQGTWKMSEVSVAGKKADIPKDVETFYIFSGDKVTMKDKGKPDKKGTFSVDSSKKPKQIDLVGEPNDAKQKMLAIYELKGDTLKIAWGLTNLDKQRPASFDGAAMVTILKKVKTSK